MRELRLRQAAAEAIEAAQVAAIAGIGKRGYAARGAMRAAAVEFRRRESARRWEAICRGAWKTRCEPETPMPESATA